MTETRNPLNSPFDTRLKWKWLQSNRHDSVAGPTSQHNPISVSQPVLVRINVPFNRVMTLRGGGGRCGCGVTPWLTNYRLSFLTSHNWFQIADWAVNSPWPDWPDPTRPDLCFKICRTEFDYFRLKPTERTDKTRSSLVQLTVSRQI